MTNSHRRYQKRQYGNEGWREDGDSDSMGGKICNFNTVKRRECSPGEINRIVQDGRAEDMLILLFVSASGTLFLLFLLALQDGSRSDSRSKSDRPLKRLLTVNASFSFSARTLSAAAWSTYGCKPSSQRRPGYTKDGRYRTVFSSSFISFHLAPNNFPISPTRGTRFIL